MTSSKSYQNFATLILGLLSLIPNTKLFFLGGGKEPVSRYCFCVVQNENHFLFPSIILTTKTMRERKRERERNESINYYKSYLALNQSYLITPLFWCQAFFSLPFVEKTKLLRLAFQKGRLRKIKVFEITFFETNFETNFSLSVVLNSFCCVLWQNSILQINAKLEFLNYN